MLGNEIRGVTISWFEKGRVTNLFGSKLGGVASLSPVQIRLLFEVPPVHFGPVQVATPAFSPLASCHPAMIYQGRYHLFPPGTVSPAFYPVACQCFDKVALSPHLSKKRHGESSATFKDVSPQCKVYWPAPSTTACHAIHPSARFRVSAMSFLRFFAHELAS